MLDKHLTLDNLVDNLLRSLCVEVVHDDIRTARAKQQTIPAFSQLYVSNIIHLSEEDARLAEAATCAGDYDGVALE